MTTASPVSLTKMVAQQRRPVNMTGSGKTTKFTGSKKITKCHISQPKSHFLELNVYNNDVKKKDVAVD